jgi:hypothetical protein
VDGFAVTMSRMIAGWDDCEYHNVLKVLDRKYSVRQVGLIDMSLLGIPQRPEGLGQEVLRQASEAHKYVLIDEHL